MSENQQDDKKKEDEMIEIRKILSSRQPIHSTEEDPLDPIEWTVRKLIPIPETYFWEYEPQEGDGDGDGDVTTTSLPSDWQRKLPWHLKAWHRTIGTADAVIQWTDRWIAQPVANATGLTAPRMSYITDHMTEEEWEAARQRLRAQKRRVLQDSETGDQLVLTTEDGEPIKNAFLELESEQIPTNER